MMIPSEYHTSGLAAAEQAEGFIRDLRCFNHRDINDTRKGVMDPETGVRTLTSEFDKTHPLYGSLFSGTQEEVDKGYVLSLSSGPRVRAYSEGGQTTTLLTGEGPYKYAYDWQVKEAGIGNASQVFIIQGREGDYALFCFPLGGKDNYLMVSVGARYGDTQCFLFQGSPEIYAQERFRRHRTYEIGEYFRDRESFPKLFEAPPLLSSPINGDLAPITLNNVHWAAQTLKTLPDGRGGFYLNPNS